MLVKAAQKALGRLFCIPVSQHKSFGAAVMLCETSERLVPRRAFCWKTSWSLLRTLQSPGQCDALQDQQVSACFVISCSPIFKSAAQPARPHRHPFSFEPKMPSKLPERTSPKYSLQEGEVGEMEDSVDDESFTS